MKVLALIISLLCTQGLLAQRYEADLDQSKITILGTSSIHDWESEVEKYNITLDIAAQNNLQVRIITRSIESGKGIMDDKTYEALKAEAFPTITFFSNALRVEPSIITASGILRVAGVQNEIAIKPGLSVKGDELRVSGEHKLKMTDYNIDPPTAMFGSLVTGDEVTIIFDIVLKPIFSSK